MITLLGSLLGFGTSFLPEVLNFFRAGQEHKHSLERMKLEMDMMARRNELKLDIFWTSRLRSKRRRGCIDMIAWMLEVLSTHYEVASGLSSLMFFLAFSLPSR